MLAAVREEQVWSVVTVHVLLTAPLSQSVSPLIINFNKHISTDSGMKCESQQ